MALLTLAAALLAAIAAAVVVVGHHLAYFRLVRPPTFGGFLETAGWLILLLVSLGVLVGGLNDPGTARSEVASAAVGVVCVGAGRLLQRNTVRRG